MIIRPLASHAELDLFNTLPYAYNEELADDLAAGRRRLEWLWVALRGDVVVARVAWWARADGEPPLLLDVFDLDDVSPDRVDIGERLLREASAAVVPDGPVEYGRMLSAQWRDDPAERRAVEDRVAAAERTGARLFVERLRLEWQPPACMPTPSGRLTFRPVADRAELVGLMTDVLDGTLDAHSQTELQTMDPAESAAHQYDSEFLSYSSPREWWRVATLPDGEPVGFVIPARNNYHPIIAYLAVLPRHRGHGYIDEILGEGTRILADNGAARIRAATDLGNVPMANAFHRAGYVTFARAIDLTWDR
ncbi:GNAT family N-acetyltransferase [Kribbella capetownensis]|uniref:GNAT family N-acetyltransferase n=1 Tax=Kribbella capetownensis TaxID=1572659 RepID=A0A4R0IIZ8_9ACTN|nr:GNAT family N-acetyltransferase [Kribbella capetownensis]TCC32657.1 GNAT family N-acetyltransferase [Kribbella capetownensis]